MFVLKLKRKKSKKIEKVHKKKSTEIYVVSMNQEAQLEKISIQIK